MVDVDEIVDELSRIKLYDPDEYKRRLISLRKNQPLVYEEVRKILSIPDTGLSAGKTSSTIKGGSLFNKSKKKIKRDNTGLVMTIIGVLIIGMLLLGAIGIFLGNLPTTSETDFNANESLLLGYQLFNELDLYLQYSTNLNVTSNEKITWSTGREYYKFNQGDFTTVLISNDYNCPFPSSCSITSLNELKVSRKTNGELLYNECDNLDYSNYNNFESEHVLSIYDEVYYYVTNELVIDSYRENIWTINGEQCAPMYFLINAPSNLAPNNAEVIQLLYEVCLSNEGIPLAIGKYYYYTNHVEVFSAYLESSNEEMLSITEIEGKSLDEWSNSELNCNREL